MRESKPGRPTDYAQHKDVHTVPHEKGWANKVGSQVESTHRTEDAAVKRGRATAKQNASEHVIHRSDSTSGPRRRSSANRA